MPDGTGRMILEMFGGAGDADLYLRHGAAPTTTAWDHRPYRFGSDERVVVREPLPGRWHVMVRGYSDFSDVTLVASFEADSAADLDGVRGEELHFTVDLPPGFTLVSFAITGGDGDADLYVRYGAPPTTRDWDGRPYLDGNEEEVSFVSPPAGRWYVMIRGYGDFSGVTLDVYGW